MTLTKTPTVVSLQDIENQPVGGKAKGLHFLHTIGLDVPPGFVLVDWTHDAHPNALLQAYQAMGQGKVAVRSSALGEDGAQASFAGQFESILHVEGEEQLQEAVQRCLQSAHSQRSQSYQQELHSNDKDTEMAVIVQRMVTAKYAGALFTAEPRTGESDRIVVEAIQGNGEELMSGHKTPSRYVFSKTGSQLSASNMEATELPETLLSQMIEVATQAEAKAGYPLDLEWALDEEHKLCWLQARPITALEGPSLSEFDYTPDTASTCFTRYNIGEILPGAVTPLSRATVASAIDWALQQTYVTIGALPEASSQTPMVVSFSGHLFLHLSNMYIIATRILGANKEGVDISLAGSPLPTTDLPPVDSLVSRLRNGVRFFRMLRGAKAFLERVEPRIQSRQLPNNLSAEEWLTWTEEQHKLLEEALLVQLHVSMRSGVANDVMLRTLTKGKAATLAHHSLMSSLLSDVGRVESTGTVEELDRLANQIMEDQAIAEQFVAFAPEEAQAWLQSPKAEEYAQTFESYLNRHGHRCFREMELFEQDWRENPLPVVRSLQSVVRNLLSPQPISRQETALSTDLRTYPWLTRTIVQRILPIAKNAIRYRERSKSLTVQCVRLLKRGYMALGQHLVKQNLLPQADLVFFLTHDELKESLQTPEVDWSRRAQLRHRIYQQQMQLSFEKVSIGRPQHQSLYSSEDPNNKILQGTPVSRGLVKGKARVARTVEEAADLQPGEILIVPYTDIGWTPYFHIAGGLATEIGGTLSHGAVVAREYRLPAIVDLPGATQMFQTGDVVVLDAEQGILALASSS
ncbi:MAG: hypothetical protein EP343_33585 [Deltaproteobacteria bacterium]|nr:MAG: hypothetical protein EP343_33585 [Deltaproteobacteria bacterium]